MERLIAQAALESDEIKRLMTAPGVNVIVAATCHGAPSASARMRPGRLSRADVIRSFFAIRSADTE